MNAPVVAKILVTEGITRFGMPSAVHSNQVSQIERELFKQMCQLLRINKTINVPYHTQCDGIVDTFNETLAKC